MPIQILLADDHQLVRQGLKLLLEREGFKVTGKAELRPDPLSRRERQVLQLIAEGKTTKGVATFLQISVKTAETHRTRIMTKLNIHETAGLVRYAIRSGVTQA